MHIIHMTQHNHSELTATPKTMTHVVHILMNEEPVLPNLTSRRSLYSGNRTTRENINLILPGTCQCYMDVLLRQVEDSDLCGPHEINNT